MRKLLVLLFVTLISQAVIAQNGSIKGRVFSKISNEPAEFATVVVQNTSYGAKTDIDGNYEIKDIPPGLYNIEVSYLGFKKKVIFEVAVDNYKPSFVDIPLEKVSNDLGEVTIKAGRIDKTAESPLSLKTIGVSEIRRNPGGNRDISKVIQSLPGAGSSVGFRNDIIIRGGGPAENRFFIDGIEIPNLNHFATQGAGGGPVGIINVDFLQDVGFYAGAFPANRGNSLSSVFDFRFKNPREDKWSSAFTLGTSDVGLRTEGPVNDKSALMVSVRRSYLQFLFQAIGLPFLPTYNDFQAKYKYKIDNKNEISYLVIGAYDVNKLNDIAEPDQGQQYLLNLLPEQNQWNYTNGIVYKHYSKNSFQTLVVSRNMLANRIYKYENNDEDSPLSFEFNSQEIENKIRFENNIEKKGWTINYGTGAQYVKYNADNFARFSLPNGSIDSSTFDAAIDFFKYSLFGQVSRSFLADKLSLSAGLRMDGHTFTEVAKNPFNQLSPRASASYMLTNKISLNANAGRYYQTPSYTVLGFKDSNNNFVNQQNNLPFIRCDHLIGGVEYATNKNSRFSIEGFYKKYNNYPVSVNRSLALANEGGDFGVVGNEAVVPTAQARSYGVEFFGQQKLYKGFYGLLAVTLFRSQATNGTGTDFVATSWDQRFIVNLTAGKTFKRNIEVGAKFRLSGGRPFTPFDTLTSSLVNVWDVTNQGVLDFNNINQNRLPFNHQLDFRIDKKWFFKKWNFNLYFDVQNAYAFQAKQPDILDVKRDNQGNPLLISGSTPARYQTQFVENLNGTVLPTLGVIIEY